MIRATWVVAVLVLAGVAASTEPVVQDSEIKKLLPDAEGIKKSAKKLSKEAREKVEKALGAKLEDREIPLIYEARATIPQVGSEKVRVLYASVAAKGAKGDLRVGVAIAVEDGRVGKVQILDNKDDKAVEARPFLDQFEGFEWTDTLLKPPSALEEAKKKAKDAKDADGRELAMFFALAEKMHPIQADYDAINAGIDKQADGLVEAAQRMQAGFGEVEKLTPGMSGFLAAGQIGRFNTQLKASQKDVGLVFEKLKAKDWAGAGKAMHELGDKCNLCHTSRDKFQRRRVDRGIGNGFFQVGFEIQTPPGPRESFQAVATAVRKAVLIATEAK